MIPRGWTPWVLEPPEMVVKRMKLSGPDYIYRSFGHKGEYTGQSGIAFCFKSMKISMDRRWSLKNLNLIAVYVVMLQYQNISYIWLNWTRFPITFQPFKSPFCPGLESCGRFAPCSFCWRFGAGGLHGCLGFGGAPSSAVIANKHQPMALQTQFALMEDKKASYFLNHLVDFDNFFVWNFSEVPWFEKQWWCSSSSSWEAAEITGAGAGEDWQIRSLKRAQFQPFLREPFISWASG